jgi:predicted secreted protein
MAKRQLRIVGFLLIAITSAFFLVHESAAVTVHLDAKDASSKVILQLGDRLRVELPSAPAKGFAWTARVLDASHLELLSKDLRPDSARPTSAGAQIFVWKAIAPGSGDIALTYARAADEKTVAPASQMAISVVVVPAVASADADSGPALEPVATYEGSLPCGACLGISIELTVFTREAGPKNAGKPQEPSIFVERRRYRGAPGGDRTVAASGELIVAHGTYADPGMTVYVLAAPDGSRENMKLEGDRLLPLDPQMLPLQFPPGQEYDLRKVATDADPEAR